MGESDSCSLSDYMIQTGRDEDSWDEIIDADFSDDEGKVLVQSSEDADLVLLSISLPLLLHVGQSGRSSQIDSMGVRSK